MIATGMAWAACVVAGTVGQSPALADAPPGVQVGQKAVTLEELPPAVRVGLRAEAIALRVPVAGVVVIVRDRESYVEAIARWSPRLQYPVLIDDGTTLGREDIARFVRAYGPERVVRWAVGEAGGPDGAAGTAGAAAWIGVERERVMRAVVSALGLKDDGEREERLRNALSKVQPAGIVVTHERDRAWPAALALAAGRVQPIFWIDTPKVPRDPNSYFPIADADAFCAEIERAAESTGQPWRGIGAGIEAVAVCLNVPARVEVDAKNYAAMTDRVGRVKEAGAKDGIGARWAWAGQIIGTPAQAAYRAMCSLFLRPESAWMFDSYEDGPGWSAFHAKGAVEYLKAMGMAHEINDAEAQGARAWRLRAARSVDAGLILVNTKGNADFFDLRPGQCKPGDVPMLSRPAMVHLVHSWSAQFPARRDTLGQRWLERGAYAFLGSVQEPYLHAFVPTPNVVARLGSSAPWGAAVRLNDSAMWKIAVFGDPLATLGRARPREKGATLPFEEGGGATKGVVTSLEEAVASAVKGGKFAEALETLTLLGRDADAKDLALALLKEKPAAITSEAARAAIMPLFRAGSNREVMTAFARLDDAAREDGMLRDALWLAAYPLLDGAIDDAGLDVLRDNLRGEQVERDASDLAAAWTKKKSRAAAREMLERLRALAPDAPRREALSRAIENLGR